MYHSAMKMEHPPTKKARVGAFAAGPSVSGAIGEVRFDDKAAAHAALALNGSNLCGARITVEMDAHSKDGTKLKVSGIPKGADWQELKDHFASFGVVAFANVKGGKKQLPVTGVVRYQTADMASAAVAMMNGAELQGRNIEVKLHGGSKDATKLMVFGLPPSFEWQELKDFAGQAGHVEFADVIVGDSSSSVGEIRYDDASNAPLAVAALHGSMLGGSQLEVVVDPSSSDKSKVIVRNIPPGIEWQELKDHFGAIGNVAHSNVKPAGKGGKGGMGQMPVTGVVRYQTAELAQAAVSMMNGALLQGRQIEVKIHGGSKDATKIMVFGLPPSFEWQELKDFAAQAGPVEFADVIVAESAAKVGEIRYDNAGHAQMAIAALHGSMLGGAQIAVMPDHSSFDGSKVIVLGLPPGIEWQELKDHFGAIGSVAHSNVKPLGVGPMAGFGACGGKGMMVPCGGKGMMGMMVPFGGKGMGMMVPCGGNGMMLPGKARPSSMMAPGKAAPRKPVPTSKKDLPGKGVGKNSMAKMNMGMMNMGMMNPQMMMMNPQMMMMNPQMMAMMGGGGMMAKGGGGMMARQRFQR